MSPLSRLSQFFGIRTGEHARFGWLLVHSLFNGICTAFFFSAAYALFLAHYDAGDLPWTYIASALAGYAVVAVFSRMERRLSFRRLLLSQLYCVLVFIVGFWAAGRLIDARWPIFLMFVSLGPLLTLLELEYWGIAVRLFDLRQGKRLFNLVNSGGVVSSIFGFLLVPLMVGSGLIVELEDLLLFAAVGVGSSIIVVREIGRNYADRLEQTAIGDQERPASSLRTLLRDRYFALTAVLMVVFTAAFYLVDLSFLSAVETYYQDQDVGVAAFVGWFYFVIKILELMVRTLLSGRLVSRYGVRFGLTALPAALLAVGVLALATGGLDASGGAFFALAALIKLLWLVLRKALFDGSFKVLYQPLPDTEKFAFQAQLEGTVSPAVTLAVGVGLLLASGAGFSALGLIWAMLPLWVVWIVAAGLLHRAYRDRLLEALAREVEKGGSESPADVVRGRLSTAAPEEFDYLAGVLEHLDATAVAPALVEIVERGSSELRLPVLQRIERHRDFDARPAAELCATASDPEVRAAAAAALRSLRQVAGGSPRIAVWLRSREPGDRELAALALGFQQDRGGDDLTGLLWDREPAVRKAALLSAGRLGEPRFWPRLISHLSSSRYAAAASMALIRIGEPVLEELEATFDKVSQETDVRLRILGVFEHAGGRGVRRFLGEQLHFPDKTVRRRALVSLSHSGYRLEDAEVPAIKNQVEAVIATIGWNLAAMLDLGDAPETLEVVEALEDENLRWREELLFLLSLLFDSRAIGLVKQHLDSGDREAGVYALEILDVVVSSDLQPLLFPVFRDLAAARASKQLEPFFPRQRMGRLERLGAITFREHDAMSAWSRACALRAIVALSPEEVDDVLVANLFHPEPMIQEVAAASILEVDPGAYARHTAKLTPEIQERLRRMLVSGGRAADSWMGRSTFGRVSALRRVNGFSTLPWQALMSLAEGVEEIHTDTGQPFPPDGEPEGRLYVLVAGRLGSYLEAGGMGRIGPDTLIAFAGATPPCRVLDTGWAYRLDGDRIYELAAAHASLVPALLAAASPPAAQELLSLSRSFESVISVAPSR